MNRFGSAWSNRSPAMYDPSKSLFTCRLLALIRDEDEESESRKPSVDPRVVLIYRYQGGSQVGRVE